MAWSLVVAGGEFPRELFPSVPEILAAARTLWTDGPLAADIAASLRRAFAGFLLGAAAGIVLPEAALDIASGLRVGAAMAFVLIVVAEMTGTTAGIGYRIYQAQLFSRADRLIACLIILGIIGALCDLAIAAATAPVTRWAAEEH
ncbi:hypothetical protein AB0M34_10870 [Nocardia sp. NPDC050193]